MANGIVFGVGKLMIDSVEVGIVQDVSVDISTSQAELRGSGSKMPVAVVTTEKSISGSASYAQFDGALLGKLTGGTYDDTAGTVTIGSEDESIAFELVLMSPADGSDLTLTLHKVVSTSLGLSFSLNDFTKPSFDFTAMADDDTGNVMTISL
jgi:hypothetical protein